MKDRRTKADLIEQLETLDALRVTELQQLSATTNQLNEMRALQARTAVERDAARNQCEGFLALFSRLAKGAP